MLKKPIILKIDKWDDLIKLSESLNYSYVFRGQSNSSWELISSLERALLKFFPIPLPEICNFILDNREYWMLREFKRKFHLYSQDRPSENDNFEWLSIMQHHNCPTRLLDFTNSLFIATHFAVSESTSDSSVWCLNIDSDHYKESVKKKYDIIFSEVDLGDRQNDEYINLCNKHIGNDIKCDHDFVLPIEPKRFTRRQSAQQGLFVAPLNPKKTFNENLFATYQIEKDFIIPNINLKEFIESSNENETYSFIKIIIPQKENRVIMRNLTRMNISRETLFPDLDGFSKSLIENVIMDESLIWFMLKEIKKGKLNS